MDRKNRPNIPASVRWAAQDGPPIPGIRRSQTMPANLRSVEGRRASDAIQRNAEIVVPASGQRVVAANKAEASSSQKKAKVLRSATLPRQGSMPLVEEAAGIEGLPPADPHQALSQRNEQAATRGRYVQPYVESITEEDEPKAGRPEQEPILVPVHDEDEERSGDHVYTVQNENEGDSVDEDGYGFRTEPSTEIERRIESLEAERRELRETLRANEKRRRLEEAKLEDEMRKRLEAAGFSAHQVKAILDQEKTKGQQRQRHRPVYAKVHKDHLSPDTLQYYDIPWEYDRNDPNYIIILREMDKHETEVLFEHTRRLRSGKLLLEPEKNPPHYAMVRKRDGDRTRKMGILEFKDGDGPIPTNPDKENPMFAWYRTRDRKLHPDVADYADYPLPITSLYRDPEKGESRDRLLEEAMQRFDKDSNFNMQRCTDRCLKAVDHSIYVKQTTAEEYALHLTERDTRADEEIKIFRRRHLRMPELDFDEFTSRILELYEPRGPERMKILLHLEQVRKSCERRYGLNKNLRHIVPHFTKTGTDDFEILSCCVQFFHLRQYGKLEDSSPSAQRPQTLLQTRYSGADKQQDLRQVICQTERGNQCLHISHLWAIIINNDTLVTASILTEDQLFQLCSIRSQTASPVSLHAKHQAPSTPQYIHIHGDSGALWLLDRAQCRAWFEFALHFEQSDFALDDGPVVNHKGKVFLPSKWPEILDENRDGTLKLTVESREMQDDKDDSSEDTARPAGIHLELGDIDLASRRPIGTTITGSFVLSLSRGQQDALPKSEDESSNEPESDAMEGYLQGLELDHELSLYRCCPSISFTKLLEIIAQALPPSPVDQKSLVREEIGAEGTANESAKADDRHVSQPGSTTSENSAENIQKDQAQSEDVALSIDSTEQSADLKQTNLIASLAPAPTDKSHEASIRHGSVPPVGDDEAESPDPEPDNLNGDSNASKEENNVVSSEAQSKLGSENAVNYNTLAKDGEDVNSIASSGDDSSKSYVAPKATDLARGVRAITQEGKEDLNGDSKASEKEHDVDSDVARSTLDSEIAAVNDVGIQGSKDGVDNDAEIRNGEDGPPKRSMSRHVAALAEGVRAIMYVFVERYDRNQLDQCAQKLCGALHKFVDRLDAGILGSNDNDTERYSEPRAVSFLNDFTGLFSLARVLQGNQFGIRTLREPPAVSLPESFTIALRSTTLAIIFANSTDTGAVEGGRIAHWATEAEKSLRDTFYGVLQSLQKPPLRTRAAARPKDVVGYLAQGLTGRIMPNGGDVQGIYNDYIRKLEHAVRAEKPRRQPVKDLRNLRNELEAMHEQLHNQLFELAILNNYLVLSTSEAEEINDAQLIHSDLEALVEIAAVEDESGTGYTSMVLENATRDASERRKEFRILKSWAATLLEEAIAQAADIDDWRNNAVVIFTIVTIIFLPLSFVASVFGMNTSDVRNMSYGQWIYWASALPFTALVVVITVWWSDLLPVERLVRFLNNQSFET